MDFIKFSSSIYGKKTKNLENCYIQILKKTHKLAFVALKKFTEV